MDREQFRAAGYAAVDRICDYFATLESDDPGDVMPRVQPGDVGNLLPKEAPTNGEEWSSISADFDRVILPGITHWQHPNFFAYFPANTTYESILADMYVGAVSNPGFNWLCSPACTELEVVVMDWVAKLLGLSPSFHNSSLVGGGVIMNSASDSCLTVCVAARERVRRMLPGTKSEDLVIVATTQTHSLGAKAALILGLKFVAVETTEENGWAVTGEQLEKVLKELKEQGKVPFIFISTLGSTSTGAIDNIAQVTAVAASYPELFIHVDAAWGGVFLSLPELRDECQLDAINARSQAINQDKGICASGEVHSFCTNLHKSGLVTFDASCLWIRDRKLLTEALDITPPFLRNKQSDLGTVVDYRNWQFSLGRRFRSLKLYFVLRSYGTTGFQTHLRSLISRATYFESLLPLSPTSLELFTPRRFSLVVLRLLLPFSATANLTAAEKLTAENDLNKAWFALLADRHDMHFTPTTVGGKNCTRIAIGSPLTKEEHLDAAWEVLRECAEEARKVVEGTKV